MHWIKLYTWHISQYEHLTQMRCNREMYTRDVHNEMYTNPKFLFVENHVKNHNKMLFRSSTFNKFRLKQLV